MKKAYVVICHEEDQQQIACVASSEAAAERVIAKIGKWYANALKRLPVYPNDDMTPDEWDAQYDRRRRFIKKLRPPYDLEDLRDRMFYSVPDVDPNCHIHTVKAVD